VYEQSQSHRGWILALLDEYDRIAKKTPILTMMNPPNLSIDPRMTSKLGQWDEDRRLITLSGRLFENALWDDVVATFKHELAHQIVSELFGIRRAKAHGEAFSRACAILGISDARTRKIAEVEERNAVYDRVRKLLALGQSDNDHEAELALAKAHELCLKYNIEQQTVKSDYSFRLVGPVMRRVPSVMYRVANIVADFYFVQYICNRYRCLPGTDLPRQQFELYGTRENLDLAEYVFYYLLNQGELCWLRFKAANKLRGRSKRLSYLRGLYEGFGDKLERRHRALRTEKALVWLGDPDLEAFYTTRNPSVKMAYSSSKVYRDAHEAGMADGARLEVAPGVNRGDGQRGLLTR
jgi:hypothetical protein